MRRAQVRDRRPRHRPRRAPPSSTPAPRRSPAGKTGTVVEFRPEWVIPEDEALGRDDAERGGRYEPFYVVRFRQNDLWPNYTGFDVDTLETEVSEHWLEPATEGNQMSRATTTNTTRTPRSRRRIRSASSRSWRRRSASWRSRRDCSRRRTIGGSPSGPSRSAPAADPSWSRRRGPTRISRRDCSPTAPRRPRRSGIDWLDQPVSGRPATTPTSMYWRTRPGAQRDRLHVVLCYPRPVLGMSPDWYRTPNYRRRLVRWPREVLAEFGLHSGPTSKCGCTTPTRSRDSW